MLQALDYPVYNKVIHRDIKPANTLYLSYPNKTFVLSNVCAKCKTIAKDLQFTRDVHKPQ